MYPRNRRPRHTTPDAIGASSFRIAYDGLNHVARQRSQHAAPRDHFMHKNSAPHARKMERAVGHMYERRFRCTRPRKPRHTSAMTMHPRGRCIIADTRHGCASRRPNRKVLGHVVHGLATRPWKIHRDEKKSKFFKPCERGTSTNARANVVTNVFGQGSSQRMCIRIRFF